jgi:hypothetical protein
MGAAAASISGSNALLLPDEVLSMMFLQLDKADYNCLHRVCRRLRWWMLRQQLAKAGTIGRAMVALHQLRHNASPPAFGYNSSHNAVKLVGHADIIKGDQRCSLHCVHDCISQRRFLESNLVQSQGQQQQSLFGQRTGGAAVQQAGASSLTAAEQVRSSH